jgi:hypothetical protein
MAVGIVTVSLVGRSQYTATLDHSHEDDDDRDDQQDVDESADGGACYKAQCPQDKEDDGNGH